MISSDPDTTPALQDVTVSWELYTGIEEGIIADEYTATTRFVVLE